MVSAAALAELALIGAGKLAIDRGGGIQPLVALLSDSERQPYAKQYAAAALARLSSGKRYEPVPCFSVRPLLLSCDRAWFNARHRA